MVISNRILSLSLGVVVSLTSAIAADNPIDPATLDFFENKIRPVLVESCYGCHSQDADKVKGGLYLDTKDGLLLGGDSGPAIVPGNPDQSLLIKAIRYTDEHLQMPPKEDKKLSSAQIADLEHWIKVGAPDPRTGENKVLAERESRLENHWAFQPIARPEPPEVKEAARVANPIDAFVLAQLEANEMEPASLADKRTLIRRAYFDLLGLPPSPAEVEEFVADENPLAYETLIDRLLASPQYGERWARHWLDIARYADTKGYVFEEERRYAYAYTYRDYVIHALNEDLPFNRFILEQIAADQLELGEDKRPLAAMGMLTLGRRFLNNQPDIIDDRIDVVTRGFMALTVQCARCHDHKYDPIPTKDYYSLYGVFANSTEPGEKPLLGESSFPKQYPEYLAEKQKREEEKRKFREEKEAKVFREQRELTADYLLAAHDSAGMDNGARENLAKERKLAPLVLRRWTSFLDERRKNTNDAIFAPWFAFTSIPQEEFAQAAPDLARQFRENATSAPVNPLIAKMFEANPPADLKELAERYRKIFSEVDAAWISAREGDSNLATLPEEEKESIRQVLYAESAPPNLSPGEITRLFDVPDAQRNRALQRRIEELDAVHLGAPPRGMVLNDVQDPKPQQVFIRGSVHNRGEEVPRQFLELIEGPDRKPFEKGSGRLELAQAIASENNPLTARVIVNRVWLNHFGAGLVTTPSDFGVRSDPPSHPELLDYLASWFMDEGWSLKKLHRFIMLSSTYRQSSEDRADYLERDPANRLLWKMNRRRLEFEPFRDTILAVSGRLDLEQGGQAVEITSEPFTTRRTVYSFIERQNLPGIFRTFDFASPDTSSAQRFSTTVPQQALFMINSPFVAEQARALATRPEVQSTEDPAERIAAIYRVAFQRDPSPKELALAQTFIEAQKANEPEPEPAPLWQYGYGSIAPTTHQVLSFTHFPHFTGNTWQGGSKLPDEKLSWNSINATGGHPGPGLENVNIRRWTAPADAIITISGKLAHSNTGGNGVRGRVISSRHRELGFWPVYNGSQELFIPPIEVKAGDTIDFIVDSNGDLGFDSFTWAPVIKTFGDDAPATAWASQEQFSGPRSEPLPLRPWEKFAQVLLMSNELAFVD